MTDCPAPAGGSREVRERSGLAAHCRCRIVSINVIVATVTPIRTHPCTFIAIVEFALLDAVVMVTSTVTTAAQVSTQQ